MAGILDYAELEQQASDVIRLQSAVVTTWQRSWTNSGRRDLQRKHNFAEMLAHYPEAEADIGTALTLTSGVRRLQAPDRYKEMAGEKDGLSLVISDEYTLLPEKTHSWLMGKFALSDTGEPQYHEVVRATDGETVYFDVWPKPDQAYDCRMHAYFYLPHWGDTADLTGQSDFLLAYAPLVLRDSLLREAYQALEMRDLTLFAAQANRVRSDEFMREAKNRELPESFNLVPSYHAAKNPIDEEAGYPFWGKK